MTQRKNLGRREFLRIIGAGSIAGLTALKLGIDAAPRAEVVSETRLLMGTLVNLTLVTDDRTAGEEAIEACLGQMENLEAVLSRHQPESQLFDLVPEFYCLDYILAWMAEAVMESYFNEKLGRDWMFKSEAGDILKKWWYQGNKNDIFEFFDKNGLGQIIPDRLISRWNEVLR